MHTLIKSWLQVGTLTFCNLYCFRGEQDRGVVVYVDHLDLDESRSRKPGHPSVCGLHNQAVWEKNQGTL